MGEEVVSKNFIEQEIDKDLAEGRYTSRCAPVSRRSRMVICISDMPSLFCLNYGLAQEVSMEHSICVLMIPIQQRKRLSL